MLAVGRIAKLFGVRGGLYLNLYTEFPADFSVEEPLFVYIDKLAVPLFCDSFEPKGVSGAIVEFADIDTPRRAEEFIGKELYLRQDDAAAELDEEFCMEDLIGFKACVGVQHGTLTDYYDNDANPLFEIELDGAHHLIPAVEEFIAGIDFKRRTIKFVLPDGLLELQ